MKKHNSISTRNYVTDHRGFTLIELLVSIGLLAALISALSTWVQIAASNQLELTGRSQFRTALAMVFARISDDLYTGDFELNMPTKKVQTQSQELFIRTRSLSSDKPGTQVMHIYRFDSRRGAITFEERGQRAPGTSSVLLGDVAGLSITKSQNEYEGDVRETLLVTVRSIYGDEYFREFRGIRGFRVP